jgi:CelD/BcsL family acetyltransferase involved in cellulose biosynthesis
MPVHVIDDPIHDQRWGNLVDRHPLASVFHTPAWLEALRRSYGYQAVGITTTDGPAIENGLVVCRVRGWFGRRLVSVPFADHCDPLVSKPGESDEMVKGLVATSRERSWGPVEFRPRDAAGLAPLVHRGELGEGTTYCLHRLDLRRDLQAVFHGFHRSSTQRAIRRAEREGVTYERGSSEEQLTAFFRLLRMTRRRHGLPPQPMAWFQNLRDSMGDRLALHVARHQGRPIAALLTLSFRNTVVYKYGGSDAAHHNLGGMPFLFWHVIQEAHAQGCAELDLGRSDLDQPGLITFKDHLGAVATPLTYYEHPARRHGAPRPARMPRLAGQVFSHLPDSALDLAGRLIYRHLG